MSLHASVGQSTHRASRVAAEDAAVCAIAGLGGAEPVALVVFATSEHDQSAVLAAARAEAPRAAIVGCSGEGVITALGSDEGTHVVGIMALGGDSLTARVLVAPRSGRDAIAAARALALQAQATGGGDERLVLLFTDGLTTNAGLLVDELARALPFRAPISGALAGEALRLDRTFQYAGDQVHSDAAVALVLSGDFTARFAVSHGCEPLGLEETITSAEDGWVREIGGRRAWEFFADYLEAGASTLDALNVAYLCLAERVPDAARAGADDDHAIRVPLRLDRESGALFFPGNLRAGARVHVALRSPSLICERALAAARALVDAHGTPDAVLHFDCAGRGRVLFEADATERLVRPVQELVGRDVPWLGLHSYGEIAPLGTTPYFHQFTAALCSLHATRRDAP